MSVKLLVANQISFAEFLSADDEAGPFFSVKPSPFNRGDCDLRVEGAPVNLVMSLSTTAAGSRSYFYCSDLQRWDTDYFKGCIASFSGQSTPIRAFSGGNGWVWAYSFFANTIATGTPFVLTMSYGINKFRVFCPTGGAPSGDNTDATVLWSDKSFGDGGEWFNMGPYTKTFSPSFVVDDCSRAISQYSRIAGAVETADGALLVVWNKDGKIFSKRSFDLGLTWENETFLSAGDYVDFSLVVMPSGKIWLFSGDTHTPFISHDHGRSWVRHPDSMPEALSSVVRLKNGALYGVIEANSGTGVRKIYGCPSFDGGFTWGSPVQVASWANNQYAPSVVQGPDGDLCCAFTSDDVASGTTYNIRFAVSTDMGATWPNYGTIVTGWQNYAPSLFVDNQGEILCSYVHVTSTGSQVSIERGSRNGDSWSSTIHCANSDANLKRAGCSCYAQGALVSLWRNASSEYLEMSVGDRVKGAETTVNYGSSDVTFYDVGSTVVNTNITVEGYSSANSSSNARWFAVDKKGCGLRSAYWTTTSGQQYVGRISGRFLNEGCRFNAILNDGNYSVLLSRTFDAKDLGTDWWEYYFTFASQEYGTFAAFTLTADIDAFQEVLLDNFSVAEFYGPYTTPGARGVFNHYARNGMYFSFDGQNLSAQDAWTVTPEHKYSGKNIFLDSPSIPYRTKNDNQDASIVLYDAGGIHATAIALFNSNICDFRVELNYQNLWTSPSIVRSMNTAVFSGTVFTDGTRRVMISSAFTLYDPHSLKDKYFRLMSGNYTTRKIVDNDQGYVELDAPIYEAASGCSYIVFGRCGYDTISYYGVGNKYMRLTIPAQKTAERFYQIGTLLIGAEAELSDAFAVGYGDDHVYDVSLDRSPTGVLHSVKRGETKRRFTLKWDNSQTGRKQALAVLDFAQGRPVALLPDSTKENEVFLVKPTGDARQTHRLLDRFDLSVELEEVK